MSLALGLAYIQTLVGVPYMYAGDNPITGFDCSGVASEFLRAVGELAYNERLSAQQLYDRYANNNAGVGYFAPGYLSFYGKSVVEIVHVGVVISPHLMVEAGGGDHTTTTLAEAGARDAFVRVRPIKYRKDFLLTIKPNYGRLGANP